MKEIILDNGLTAQQIEDQVYTDGDLRVMLSHLDSVVLLRDYPLYAVAFQTYMGSEFGKRDETKTWAFA